MNESLTDRTGNQTEQPRYAQISDLRPNEDHNSEVYPQRQTFGVSPKEVEPTTPSKTEQYNLGFQAAQSAVRENLAAQPAPVLVDQSPVPLALGANGDSRQSASPITNSDWLDGDEDDQSNLQSPPDYKRLVVQDSQAVENPIEEPGFSGKRRHETYDLNTAQE